MKPHKCPSCGAELNNDNRDFSFCQYCGAKIMSDDHRSSYRFIDEAKIHENETKRMIRMREMEIDKERWENERIEKEIDKFKSSKLFKFLIVAFFISIIIAIKGFSDLNFLLGIIAIIQAALFGIAWLIKLRVIKERKDNLHILFIIIGLLLVLPEFKLSGFDFNNINKKDEVERSTVFLGDKVLELFSKNEE